MSVPLYEAWNERTRRSTRVTIDSETGLPLIERVMDTRPVIEANKRQASSFDKHRARKQDFVHVARIDINTWANLVRLGIAGDEKALNAWLDLREARAFRVDDARRL